MAPMAYHKRETAEADSLSGDLSNKVVDNFLRKQSIN